MSASVQEVIDYFDEATMMNREELISSLQDQLYRARRSIISLVTEEAQKILWGYVDCESQSDAHRWRNIAAREIIKLAEPIPSELFHSSNRAYCPLCKDGALVLYESGFKLPEGLRRHLIGWGDENNHCIVFGAAMNLARDHWGDRFREKQAEEAARIARERRRSEILYKIDAKKSPVLIDEGIRFDFRSVDDMAWAEDRLLALGFKIDLDRNVKSYTSESDTFIVYADPRRKYQIEFSIYLKQFEQVRAEPPIGYFGLSDHWKNSIEQKYQNRLLKTIREADEFHETQRYG
jgi:hypothetical protein